MNTILELVRKLIPGGVIRAKVLQESRAISAAAAAWVLTSVYVYVTTHWHFMSTTSAAMLAGIASTAAGGLILLAGSMIASWLDPEKVATQINAVASKVAVGIATNAVTPAQVVAAAQTDHSTLSNLIAQIELPSK